LFIAMLFLQYKTIRSLEGEAERLKKLRPEMNFQSREGV